MASRGRPKRRRRSGSIAWQIAFEAEVRQLPLQKKAELARWTPRWPRWPRRIFWVIDPTGGGRYPLI